MAKSIGLVAVGPLDFETPDNSLKSPIAERAHVFLILYIYLVMRRVRVFAVMTACFCKGTYLGATLYSES
jgi:hypothetical protein